MLTLGRRILFVGSPLLIFVAIACHEVTAALPPSSQRYTPPPVYQLWWEMTEACSGHTGSLSAIQWYVVPGADSISDGSDAVAGYWSSGDNRIVLIDAGQFNGPLVRHEMLHALIRVDGHPRSEFVERCGGIVDCRVTCVGDAGPPPTPPAGTPHVPPDSLVLGIELQPTTPGVNTFDGYFTIAVTARNPADHPVIAMLQPSGNGDPSVSFTCSLQGAGGRLSFTSWAWDPEATYFAAGETKRQVFDLVEGTAPGVANIGLGEFAAHGAFGAGQGITETIELTP
jgi:hypothetical protein